MDKASPRFVGGTQINKQDQNAKPYDLPSALQDIVSVEEFEGLMESYHQQQLKTEQEVIISMDGKTVRGTIPAGEYRGTHLLAIYVPQQGLVLAEAEVDRKENEIVVAPHLLNKVSLAGAIVVADAMHTQKALCSQVIEAGGDYVLTVKEKSTPNALGD